jgi:hypothetical protein
VLIKGIRQTSPVFKNSEQFFNGLALKFANQLGIPDIPTDIDPEIGTPFMDIPLDRVTSLTREVRGSFRLRSPQTL